MKQVSLEFELNEELKKQRRQMFESLLTQPEIIEFKKKYDLSDADIEPFAQRYQRWLINIRLCNGCEGLHMCRQNDRGLILDMVVDTGILMQEVRKCHYLLAEESQRSHLKKFIISDMPEHWAQLSLASLDLDNESDEYLLTVTQMASWVRSPLEKGYYVYGLPGVGKTYLVACVANMMAKNGKTVAFVHVPTLMQRLKSYLDNRDEFENVIYKMKSADIAVFDDIGAESVTSWVRDELLLPILNDRAERKRTTWFTSNEDLKSLKNHYMYNQKGEKEEMKAIRILERIEALAVPLQLRGNNRRKG
ncbi:MAG: ATP-binding protein [Erysipelothrix sp.]|nr:ATP-binding protein [Erysipelothrix sp.]